MLFSTFSKVAALQLLAVPFTNAQSDGSGYTGYSLSSTGDGESTTYETLNTNTNVSTVNPPPDVFLNASVHVGEINIEVQNLTAKINLAAQVLQLLQFNAGVDLSIDRVSLLIQNVTAEVVLEARLENLVLMIGDVLDSLDLNPVLATLGQDVDQIVNTTVGGLTGNGGSNSTGSSGGLSSRSGTGGLAYSVAHNILYSMNDYSGHTHTNRVLAQNGSIIDQSLDNDGNIYGERVVGYYLEDMSFDGYNVSVVDKGQYDRESQYIYAPFNGLNVVSAIFTDAAGSVVATQVLSELNAGGSSTIS
ncbi:hypothetical protein MMC25_005008 [Agyrium rufum]|nr:hypothetical protein [Agyrium rufum]